MDSFYETFGTAGKIAVVLGIACLVLMATSFALYASAAFGAGVSLYNYGLAFKNNVKPE